jgi:hypothetical protein
MLLPLPLLLLLLLLLLVTRSSLPVRCGATAQR